MNSGRKKPAITAADDDLAPQLLRQIEQAAGVAVPTSHREACLKILRHAEKLVLIQILERLSEDAAQVAIKQAQGARSGK